MEILSCHLQLPIVLLNLNHHESPEDIELYFCGPPLMNQAVQKMGEDFGIPDEHIRFDDFGG
jgi:Na+-transporting NADH:ubiquinone oxidoreductase subunit F